MAKKPPGGASGLATWFCCGRPSGSNCPTPNTTGACGTCQNTIHGCAWPNISAACLAFDNPGACGVHPARFPCGHRFTVTNRCSGRAVGVTIVDCGPQTNLFCHVTHCCGTTCGSNRIVDLTPAAFSAIASLAVGVLPASVR
jgi:hypothetical protein